MQMDEETKWTNVSGVVDYIPPDDLVCLKHEVGSEASCRGHVMNGECKRCKQSVPGVLSYSFEIIMRDITHSDQKLLCKAADSTGEGLFGMTARAWNDLADDKKNDKLEQADQMPYFFKAFSSYNPKSDETVPISCQMTRLPDSVLKE